MERREFVAAGTVLLGLLACVPVAAAAGDATGRAAYEAVLYPQGLPARVNPFTGKSETVAFAVHGEVELPALGARALVYSERLGPLGGDGAYRVYLGLLKPADGGLRLGGVEDLTEFIPVSLEFAGNCLNVDAALDSLELAGRPALHVNLWGVLAGSGSISGASDLFFGFTEGGRLERLLVLAGSSRFSRAGLGHSEFQDARLTLATARDGRPWLLVRTRSVSQAQGRPPREQTGTVGYTLKERVFEPGTLTTDELSALESSGRALSRSRNLPAEPPEN